MGPFLHILKTVDWYIFIISVCYLICVFLPPDETLPSKYKSCSTADLVSSCSQCLLHPYNIKTLCFVSLLLMKFFLSILETSNNYFLSQCCAFCTSFTACLECLRFLTMVPCLLILVISFMQLPHCIVATLSEMYVSISNQVTG